jgi:3-hydroxyacyl-CoA dehydrogenase
MDGNSPQEVDAAMVHCLRMPMGPCALMDLIGIDVVIHCLETMRGEHGERFEPAPVLREMLRAGRLGRKSGGGFTPARAAVATTCTAALPASPGDSATSTGPRSAGSRV